MPQDNSSPLPSGSETVRQGFTGRWFWLLVFVAATLVLLFGSYKYYRHEIERIRQEKYDDIAAIARLKAGHIQQWRKSLLRDVRALSTGPMFRREVGEWLRNPGDDALRTHLRDRLANERGQGELADALLVDREGNVLLSASDSPQPLDVQERNAVQEAIATRSPRLSGVYRSPKGTIMMSAIAPVTNAEGAAIALGMFRCNLESELFPLIQTWPTPSKTAETLLVRKEDGGVLFLNNLRHRPDTALTLRDPLTKEDLPAVQAVLGKRGMFLGKDYRGQEVLAELSHIPDSPWFMVSKVDTSEIMEEAKYRGGVIVIFSLLFILLAASATAFGYRHRQVGLYKKMYRSERQQRVAQEEFRTTLYSIGDAVITTDTAGIVKQMNPVAEDLTGMEESEARGRPLEEVFHIISEDSRLPAENPVYRVLRDGMIVGLANHTLLISKHGTEYPIADSAAPIRDNKGVILGVVLVFRDQTDERKSQKELEEKERLLRETGRMARVGGWELDADSFEVRWTEETYRIHEVQLGYKPPLEEAINFFHSDDRAKLRQAIQNALQLGDAYDMETRFVTATGKQLWTRTIGQPEIIDGKVVKLSGTFQDITERKQAEEALRGSEELYRSLFEQAKRQEQLYLSLLDCSADPIVVYDLEGKVRYLNAAHTNLFGWTLEEALGKRLTTVPESDQGVTFSTINQIVNEGLIARTYETQRLTKEGRLVDVSVSGARYLDHEGKTAGMVVILRDITEKKRAEVALRESEEKYRRIVETANEGIWAMDGEFQTTFVNQRMADMLGYSIDEMLGKAVHTFMFNEDLAEHEHNMSLRRRGEDQSYERRFRRKDGETFWTIVSARSLKDAAGNFAGSFGMFTDITERKKADAKLLENQRRLEQSQRIASIGTWEWNPATDETHWSDETYGLFGIETGSERPSHELARRHVHPEDIETWEKALANALETGTRFIHDYRAIRTDGSVIWIHNEAEIVRDGNGRVISVLGTAQDITVRKHSEERLRESEARYRAVFDNAGIGIDLLDRDGRIVQVNRSLVNILGYSDEEFLQLTFQDITHPEDKEISKRNFEALKSGQIDFYRLEKRYLRKDGSILWADLTTSAIYGPHGEHTGMIGVISDITERKKTEDALRESEARFKHVFESANVGKSVTLLTGEMSVNKAFCDMLGYSEHELRNTTWQKFTPPEEVGTIQEMLDQLVKGEKDSVRFNKRYIHKNGSYVWADASVVIRRDHGGKPLHFITTAVDITERKRAEEALRESEQRYRAVVDNLQIGISVINSDMEIIAVNPFFHRHYPHVRPLEGQLCHEMYNDPPSPSPCSYCPCIQTFQDGLVHESVTETPAGGRIRNYRLVSCPVKDGQGNVDLVIELVEDITERRSLQAQLAQAQKMEAVGTLAGGVAHDFNNVLQVALGFSELILGDEDLPQHYRADLLKIYEAAKRGADLVQRLLTFSRKTEIKPQPLDLNVRITELRKMLERTLPKMVDIQLVQDVKLAKINADKTHIDQVLMNLAVNARDAMPDGGKLSFETANVTLDEEYASTNPEANPGPHVLLTVTDTGMGIDKDTLEHIFEPFYTTKGVGEGTGLGLAMVHGIVKQHGGHIRCYSEPGHGTTFKIYFPALVADEEPGESALRVTPRGGCETILLVDDEELIRDLGSRILTKAGYKVITASDGEEALTLYQRRTDEISLVVLDVIMPLMGGKQCLEALLRLNPSIKVVIASGFSSNGPVKDALSAGAKGFINKPYDMRQMLEVVREVLDAE